VKIYLLFNNQRIAKKKTHVKKRTLNPVFNESFVFDLPKSEDGLASVQLEFMLLDWDRVTKNEVSKYRLCPQYRFWKSNFCFATNGTKLNALRETKHLFEPVETGYVAKMGR
jgi:hypothetical protein